MLLDRVANACAAEKQKQISPKTRQSSMEHKHSWKHGLVRRWLACELHWSHWRQHLLVENVFISFNNLALKLGILAYPCCELPVHLSFSDVAFQASSEHTSCTPWCLIGFVLIGLNVHAVCVPCSWLLSLPKACRFSWLFLFLPKLSISAADVRLVLAWSS